MRAALLAVILLFGCDNTRDRPRSPSGPRDGSLSDLARTDLGFGDGGGLDGSTLDGAVGDGAVDPCDGVTCSGHGRCAISQGQLLCLCDSGYEADGLSCRLPTPTPPSVTSVNLSPSIASPSDTLTVEADVSDPDGLADVRSGLLQSERGEELGVFTPVTPGRWRWSGRVSAILASTQVTFAGSGTLVLVARFYDATGGDGVGRATLTITCPSDEGICTGSTCESLRTNDHCTGCGLTCPSTMSCLNPGYCSGYAEAVLGVQSCDQACGAGFTCTRATVLGYRTREIPCSMVSPTQEVINFTIQNVTCDCFGAGVPQPAGQNCTQACAPYATSACRQTHVELREDATGLVSVESDNCQPPYLRFTNGLAVGLPFNKTFGLNPHLCTCEGPPR